MRQLFQYQIIQSIIVLLVFIVIKSLINYVINRRRIKQDINRDRVALVKKFFNILLIALILVVLSSIWGLEQSDILLFIASILTVIGVAFFAQWSHLSNITAGIILFFTKDMRIGDYVTIMDPQHDIKGEIKDVGMMFFHVYSEDLGLISIPNTLMLQKMLIIHGQTKPKKTEECTLIED